MRKMSQHLGKTEKPADYEKTFCPFCEIVRISVIKM